jgi:GGDEF domain-containing protein
LAALALALALTLGALGLEGRAWALVTAGAGGAIRVTASVGVAVMKPQPQSQSLQALLDGAEAALQAARLAGGNCVRAVPYQAERATSRGPSVGDNQAARGDG